MLSIFLGGLSLHVSARPCWRTCSAIRHDLGGDLQGGRVQSNFFHRGAQGRAQRFKFSFVFAEFCRIVAMVDPRHRQIGPLQIGRFRDFIAILPMSDGYGAAHLLLPIVLNPALMTFSW